MNYYFTLALKKFQLLMIMSSIAFIQGCASTIDISEIEGLSSTKAYSQSNFVDGSYRFSEGGFPTFNWGAEEAIIERRYDDAVAALVKKNRASDEAYYALGVAAEAKGYYQGAQVYYELAHMLNTQQPMLARCPLACSTMFCVQKACYGVDAEKMLKDITRVKAKAEGAWTDSIIEYKDGRIYIGEINENNRPDGWGELSSPSGEFYYGEFKAGVQSGAGSLSIKTGSSTLYFKGRFLNGEPTAGYLYNPKMKTLGFSFGKDMQFIDGGFYYLSGEALGSRPADNNYWFADGWGSGFMRAIKQGFVYQATGVSPLLANDDPLISEICTVQSSLISSAASAQKLCE